MKRPLSGLAAKSKVAPSRTRYLSLPSNCPTSHCTTFTHLRPHPLVSYLPSRDALVNVDKSTNHSLVLPIPLSICSHNGLFPIFIFPARALEHYRRPAFCSNTTSFCGRSRPNHRGLFPIPKLQGQFSASPREAIRKGHEQRKKRVLPSRWRWRLAVRLLLQFRGKHLHGRWMCH